MVARSNEDGEEAFMCVNVERPRSSGNQSGASFCDRAQKQCRPLLAIADQCELIHI